ncbi:uncharacterized protein I303_103339 [Kwoniella dejecticola CBS 10117]|uniref:Uncharacterized protein n=1 Tax=Kwoniella dejecticola CBS 10117 TaxID=1296121 RepID=A0A1A6A6G7_9TREE|nr:uncharacterized protein I303_03362 [Kwoniella dejecticola CBS 10117]OBR85651.1 hypothetical protein I303_03362 [Kwoniella dejecticola CBS 10117]
MRAGIDSAIYLITCALSTVCLAACGNSLHRRNVNVGKQSAASLARGIRLILATNDLSGAGYALSVGAGGIAVGTLILFMYSLRILPMTQFIRRIFFLSPLMLAINTLLLTASGIAVTYLGRHGTTSIAAFVGTQQLPESVVRAQAKAQGVPLDYWSNDYVKFMVASPWPVIPFALASLYFAYRAYKVERPSAQTSGIAANENGVNRKMSGPTDKPEIEHVA